MKVTKKFSLFLIALFIVCSSLTVSAASLKIKVNKKSVNYTGKQLKVAMNGKNISISSTPGIILDKYTMVPYYNVFVKSSLKMKSSYDAKKACLTLCYHDITVKLYNQKKTMYVNGKKKTLPAAPRFVTFTKANKTAFMVPVKPICEVFGLTYSYSSSKKLVSVSDQNILHLTVSGKNVYYTGKQLKVTCNGKNIALSGIPALTLNGCNMASYYYVFEKTGLIKSHSYDSDLEKLTLFADGKTIVMYNNKTTAYVNNVKHTLPAAPCFVTYKKANQTVLMVPVKTVCSYLDTSYAYSSSKKTISLVKKTETEVTDTVSSASASKNPMVLTNLVASSFLSMNTYEFIRTIGPIAQADARSSHVMASVTMAQAILESGWGKSELAQNANNLFGMKTSLSGNNWSGSAWDGKTFYRKKTAEYDKNNKQYFIYADFRKYPSVSQSIADHSAYLTHAMNGSSLRYQGLTTAKTYTEQLRIIRNGGYATSTTYVQSLCSIIEKYNLDQWD